MNILARPAYSSTCNTVQKDRSRGNEMFSHVVLDVLAVKACARAVLDDQSMHEHLWLGKGKRVIYQGQDFSVHVNRALFSQILSPVVKR